MKVTYHAVGSPGTRYQASAWRSDLEVPPTASWGQVETGCGWVPFSSGLWSFPGCPWRSQWRVRFCGIADGHLSQSGFVGHSGACG